MFNPSGIDDTYRTALSTSVGAVLGQAVPAQNARMPAAAAHWAMIEGIAGGQEVWGAGEPQAWEEGAADRFATLLGLAAGWDGHGGRPIRRAVCDFAMAILPRLMAGGGLPLPGIVPLSYGGIQMEWHRKGWDVEIEIEAPNRVLAFVRNIRSGDEQEIEMATDLTPLLDVLASLRD